MRTIASIGVTLLPIICLGYGVWGIVKFCFPKEWPVAEATIINSDIEKEEEPGNYVQFRNKIEFEYYVDGKRYTSSTKKAPMSFTYNKDEAKYISEKYAKGRRVSILYNPLNSSVAILGQKKELSTIRRIVIVVFIFGILFSPLSVILLVVMWR